MQNFSYFSLSSLTLLVSDLLKCFYLCPWGFPGDTVVKKPPANAGDAGSISGSGRSPGGGHGNPLQYSYLENPGGLRSTGSQSRFLLKQLSTHACMHRLLTYVTFFQIVQEIN